MSITDIQHGALGDLGLGLTTQSTLDTAYATFQAADQALMLAQFTGQPTTIPTTTRATALSVFKTLAAALT